MFYNVRGTDEQHLGQVHRHVQVVVQEVGVLLRVQEFQQSGRRVAVDTSEQYKELVINISLRFIDILLITNAD